MSQAKGPRRFDHYPSALILFWEEEIGGIAFFRALSQGFAGRQKRALELMAEAEVITADLLRPLLDKYGLKAGDAKTLTASGIKEAKALGQVTWADLLKRWQIGFPDFIDEFEQIERLGPPEDLPRLKAVTAHEIAAVDFLNLEMQGSAESLRPLEIFLETYAVGGLGRSALNSK